MYVSGMIQTVSSKVNAQHQSSSDKTDDGKRQREAASKEGFGGMKKGFLFNSKPKTSAVKSPEKSACENKSANAAEQDDAIPFIRPNKEPSEGRYQFSEVQQAMKVDSALSLNKGS